MKESIRAGGSPPRTASVDWAGVAEDKAISLAETAQSLHARMGGAMALYNTQSESAIHAQVEDYRSRFGDALAQSTEASLRLLKSDARQSLEESRAALEAGFTVSGTPYAYDSSTDRFTAQPFSAEAAVPGARLRYDSAAGASVAVGNGPFKSLPGARAPQGVLDLTA